MRKVALVGISIPSTAHNSTSTAAIDLSKYGFLTAPYAIPLSDGWLETQRSLNITATSMTARATNRSGSAHTGSAYYLLVELA